MEVCADVGMQAEKVFIQRRICQKYIALFSTGHFLSANVVLHKIHNAHARVMEAENSTALTIHSNVNGFIALGWRSENDYGF